LYSGEQFDLDLRQQYLRARYYDQGNGRFNRLDPFGGARYDPQSLHKYAYCHCDPIQWNDPTGERVASLMWFKIGLVVLGIIAGITIGAIVDGVRGAIIGALIGAVAGAFIGWMWGEYLFFWSLMMWDRILLLIERFGAPASKFLQGRWGRVSYKHLDRLRDTNPVTLYSRLSKSLDATRPLHTATTEALARAGGRADYILHVFKIPSGILHELARIGELTITVTRQVGSTVIAYEYAFTARATAYIAQFLERVGGG